MRTLVLAAGFGTRMRPITDHLPKALVPVCGRPLLEHCLIQLAARNLGPFLVNTHYFHEQVEAFAPHSPVPFLISHERESILGSGGGIYYARDWLGADPFFCVVNAEPLREVNLAGVIETFCRSGADIGLVSIPVTTNPTIFAHAGTTRYAGTAADDLSKTVVYSYAFTGITLFTKNALELFTASDFSVVPLWRRAQEHGAGTIILSTTGWWRDIGTPSELAGVYRDYLRGALPLALPNHLHFDRHGARVLPVTALPDLLLGAGEGVWCELESLPLGCRLERSIVLKGAQLEPRLYRDELATPWGTFALEPQEQIKP